MVLCSCCVGVQFVTWYLCGVLRCRWAGAVSAVWWSCIGARRCRLVLFWTCLCVVSVWSSCFDGVGLVLLWCYFARQRQDNSHKHYHTTNTTRTQKQPMKRERQQNGPHHQPNTNVTTTQHTHNARGTMTNQIQASTTPTQRRHTTYKTATQNLNQRQPKSSSSNVAQYE